MPDSSKGELPPIDEETGKEIDPEHISRCLEEYAGPISFFVDIESGFITITLSEYRSVPPATLELWRIYKGVKARLGKAK